MSGERQKKVGRPRSLPLWRPDFKATTIVVYRPGSVVAIRNNLEKNPAAEKEHAMDEGERASHDNGVMSPL